MPVSPLSISQLRRVCRHEHFTFESTADIPISADIIGQARGIRAIEFGIDIQSEGFNIFVLGQMGTGRATAIERFLHNRTQDQPEPFDWVYVHNFTTPHQPRAISLPAGEGAVFSERMKMLHVALRAELPEAFDGEAYAQAMEMVSGKYEQQHMAMMQVIQQLAEESGFAIVSTTSGFNVTPLKDGRPITQEEWQALPLETRQQQELDRQMVTRALEETLDRVQLLNREATAEVDAIDAEIIKTVAQPHFQLLREAYTDDDEILLYLGEVQSDVAKNISDFAPSDSDEPNPRADFERYGVNVLIDNGRLEGAPVIIEQNPTYHDLIGRLEYEMREGVVSTHFMNIKAGSLHQANGGYLILNARDVLKDSFAWEALKRALKTRQVRVQPMATMNGGTQVLAKSLDPEPIPLNVKIVLMGSPQLYYALYENDDEFNNLFKVRSDFGDTMPRTDLFEESYAQFIATRCTEEGLHHFDKTAVERIIEYGSRLARHQDKLSTRFGAVADVVREASYWAGRDGRELVTAVDVKKALSEHRYRANRLEEDILEDIIDGTIFIATDGAVVGQANGLSVMDTGEYAFGTPGRLTVRTYMGEEGVVHIEQETDMSGPIHEKGFLTLKGYLGGLYAQNQPLSLGASMTFEQSYGLIDGDSASSTEIYVLLSSLSDLPIKQGIAITGSVNQRGEVQPIGGANEKIEGFFNICHARGLTGEQGVMIPAVNVPNLMLTEEVITAVSNGKFNIYPISTIDEGIELLTGVPAGEPADDGNYPEGTVHHAVMARLRALAEKPKDAESDGADEEE